MSRICVATLVEKDLVLVEQIAFRPFRHDFDAHAGPVGHVDHAVLNDGVRKALDDIAPPFRIADGIFEGK